MTAYYTKPAFVVNADPLIPRTCGRDVTSGIGRFAACFAYTRKPDDLCPLKVCSAQHSRHVVRVNIDFYARRVLCFDWGLMGKHCSEQEAEQRGEKNRDCIPNVHRSMPPKDLNCENSLPHFPVDIREPLTYIKSMNTLPQDKKLTILNAMIEGNSIRSTERMTGVHRDTIMRLTARTGEQCRDFLDVRIRNVRAERVQADEIWTYVFKKQARIIGGDSPSEFGDQYVFVGMDADTKLVISHLVGKRESATTYYFMRDLRERVTGRIQLTTDGFKPYRPAVEDTFGGDVDYAQLVKVYGEVPKGAGGRGWYAAAKFMSAYSSTISGVPRPSAVSTSYVERQNLTMRMQMRRFTRLTNAFSKKLENLKASVALHFAHYNFVRVHQSLRITPAMAAGLTGHVWEMEELLEAIQ
jgi:IS1 family transposase